TPNSKFFNNPEVVEISDTDDEQTTVDTTEYEYSASEIVSEKSNWDKVSVTRNNRGVQRELSTLSHESDTTNNSGSVFNTPLSKSSLICELDNTYK
ncbi:9360_t:CDS:2, partial [Racocetra fulgida]